LAESGRSASISEARSCCHQLLLLCQIAIFPGCIRQIRDALRQEAEYADRYS